MVLDNLLRNAIGYTESGEVRVTLDATEIRVEDTGPGVGSGDNNELFYPYLRGSNSNGAGLGLSLVKRLCDRRAGGLRWQTVTQAVPWHISFSVKSAQI